MLGSLRYSVEFLLSNLTVLESSIAVIGVGRDSERDPRNKQGPCSQGVIAIREALSLITEVPKL